MPTHPPPPRARAKLGQMLTPNQRTYVFSTAEGLEVDQVDGYEVTRRRVFYADIVAVTLHRQYGVASIAMMAVLLAIFITLIAVVVVFRGPPGMTLCLALCALPAAVWLFIKSGNPEHRVTVFGRRTKAMMRWHLAAARARAVFDQVIAQARAQQDAERDRLAAAAPSSAPFGAPGAPGPAAGASLAIGSGGPPPPLPGGPPS